jgi:hypothetical protein
VDSALAKYARAQKHLAELRAAIDEAHAADLSDELSRRVEYPYGDDDPRAVVILRLELRSPAEWSLIMGDILTNLRAALDHAVYGHATSRKTLNAQQRKVLYHPMLTERSEWDGTPETPAQDGTVIEAKVGVRDKLKDLVSPDVLQVIEKNQPFNADGDPFWHGLAVLSGLVNRDKHRAVLDIPVNIAELAMGDSNVEIISEGELTVLPDGAVEKEVTLRRAVRRAGAAPRYTLGLLSANTEFLEQIEIPNTGGERRSFITTMEKLVEATGTYLDELKAAGC